MFHKNSKILRSSSSNMKLFTFQFSFGSNKKMRSWGSLERLIYVQVKSCVHLDVNSLVNVGLISVNANQVNRSCTEFFCQKSVISRDFLGKELITNFFFVLSCIVLFLLLLELHLNVFIYELFPVYMLVDINQHCIFYTAATLYMLLE